MLALWPPRPKLINGKTQRRCFAKKEKVRMTTENEVLIEQGIEKRKLSHQLQAPVFIGKSAAMCDILQKIKLVANSQAPVLITGESGTGKEIIARLVHHASDDLARPFVAINSAALPKDVVDNELFGHEKEAFTGAVSKKPGCFELAHNGTLFLDEIVEMHTQTQAKLLRAIENKCIRRLGGREEIHVEVRIVAATNKDIAEALHTGELREDLFYRLSVIEIALPPLRDRKEDIPLLVEHFLTQLSSRYGKPVKTLSPESMEMMLAFDWPGNIRELRNVVERMLLVCPEEIISPKHLPERLNRIRSAQKNIVISIGTSLQAAEKLLIDQTLASVDQNKSAAARILGVSRKTLHNKLNGRI
jgi:transcriptional regulator with PAS, ATPase and Fis domain